MFNSNLSGPREFSAADGVCSCDADLLLPVPDIQYKGWPPPHGQTNRVLLSGSCRAFIYQRDSCYTLIARKKDSLDEILNVSLISITNYKIKQDTWLEIEVLLAKQPRIIVLQFKKCAEFDKFLTSFEAAFQRISQSSSKVFGSRCKSSEDLSLPVQIGNLQTLETTHLDVGAKDSNMIKPDEKQLASFEPKGLMVKLEKSISAGDVIASQEIVAELARHKVKLNILQDISSPTQDPQDKEFSVKVYVEDRETSTGPITMKVKPSNTIEKLKKKIQFEYKFPVEVQRWIIGKRMPKDGDTLSKMCIKEGYSMYLYIVSAESVNLTKEMFDQRPLGRQISGQNIEKLQSGDFFTTNSPNFERGGINRSRSDISLLSIPERSNTTLNSSELPNIASPPEQYPVYSELSDHKTEQTPKSNTKEQKLPPKKKELGWQCPCCTYINLPIRPGCELCTANRPADYTIPGDYQPTEKEITWLLREKEADERRLKAEKEEREANLQRLINLEDQDLILNSHPFECPICISIIDSRNGIILRECLHSFCKDCLRNAIKYCENPFLKCPYQDELYSCDAVIQEREIKALVSEKDFAQYLQLGLRTAESQLENTFHCRTPNCPGWCIYDDEINFFSCPVCNIENCLTCKAIHKNMDCKSYQLLLKINAMNDQAAKRTQTMLDEMERKGDAMKCPKCEVILTKKVGCDWIKCSICQTEICWVTKGFRWGPKGFGDTSRGCRCKVDGKLCHPECHNCH